MFCKASRVVTTCGRQVHSSSSSRLAAVPATMSAWGVHDYGTPEKLTTIDNMRVPTLQNPEDVLVKVHATSVNPIDVALIGGYGRVLVSSGKKLFSRCSATSSAFPLVPGRDFSGVVVRTGQGNHQFAVGDEVWGCVTVFIPSGSHAEYVAVPKNCIAKKPSTLNHCEAASIPYAALSVWSALTISAGLRRKDAVDKRVLILGGSGGTGTLAIQLLKEWRAEVTTTCAADAEETMASLGADVVLDYASPTLKDDLKNMAGFDLILDLASQKPDFYMKLLKKNGRGKFVTLTGPLLRNLDQYGLPMGVAVTAANAGIKVVQGYMENAHFRWAYYVPNREALTVLTHMAEERKIVPIIQRVVPYSKLPDAFKLVSSGPNRGKTVVELISE